MNRRGLLKLFASGAVAAPSMSVAEAAKITGTSAAMGGTALSQVGMPATGNYEPSHMELLQRNIWRRQEARREAVRNNMPASIATKRSWSPSFKEAVFIREELLIREAIDKLEDDETLCNRFMAALKLSNQTKGERQ